MSKLAEANHYESIVAILDKVDNEPAMQTGSGTIDFSGLLGEYRVGAEAFKASMSRFMSKARTVNTYDVVQPTISWAQSLTTVYLEVKLAHRFDAPGCANHTEVAIRVEHSHVNMQVLCLSISSKIKYVLDLPLWGEISIFHHDEEEEQHQDGGDA